LLGAAALGIRNILCLSGYHQTLTDHPETANVYDLDSTQLLNVLKKMREQGELLNGEKDKRRLPRHDGRRRQSLSEARMDLNIIRLTQKVEAGAEFIQTHAVFDMSTSSSNGWIR
jgi:methylenetetrahydrofolate reductase (NADPH)